MLVPSRMNMKRSGFNVPVSPESIAVHCRNVSVVGSSGGACAGGLLFVDEDLEDMVTFICECAADARSHWRGAFRIRSYIRTAIERFCPTDIAERVAGRMEVSVTKLLGFQNMRWRSFKDKVLPSVLCMRYIVLDRPSCGRKRSGHGTGHGVRSRRQWASRPCLQKRELLLKFAFCGSTFSIIILLFTSLGAPHTHAYPDSPPPALPSMLGTLGTAAHDPNVHARVYTGRLRRRGPYGWPVRPLLGNEVLRTHGLSLCKEKT